MINKKAIYKMLCGIRRYGILRSITGLVTFCKFKILKPQIGIISTSSDGLSITFKYPSQFMATLVIFKELIEPELELLRYILKKNAVFFDIGAGVGTYLTFIAKLIDGPIHAFEPVEENLHTIGLNLKANHIGSKIILNPVALSNKKGFCHMQKDKSLFLSRLTFTSSYNNNSIEMTTIDTYCSEHNIDHIDVMKIDVEGHEPEVIEGAKEMLINKRIAVIIMEANRASQQFYESLVEMGFAFFYYNYRNGTLKRIIPICYNNIIALKPSAFHSNVVLIQHEMVAQLPIDIKIH